jgi:hypothetical protein
MGPARARAASDLERLHHERHLVDTLGCQLVELPVLERIAAVHDKHDLLGRSRDPRDRTTEVPKAQHAGTTLFQTNPMPIEVMAPHTGRGRRACGRY